jgi:hypothetical protein
MQYVLGGELLVLLAILTAMGLCYCGVAFVEALRKILKLPLGGIPILDKITGGFVDRGLQHLSNTMGSYAEGLSGQLANNWHRLATLADRTGWAIWHTNLAVERLFAHVTGFYALPRLYGLAKSAYHLAFGAHHQSVKAMHDSRPVAKESARPGSTALGKSAQAVNWPLSQEFHRFETATRAQLRALELGLEGVTDVPFPRPINPADAVKDALAKIKARLRKARRWRRGGRRRGRCRVGAVTARTRFHALYERETGTARQICGMDANALEALLGESVMIFSLLSIRQFAHGLQAVTDDAAGAVRGFVSETRA